MAIEYRLIYQYRLTHYGDVPLDHVRYILQRREVMDVPPYTAEPWTTLPIVDFDSLTSAERAEIIDKVLI